jgi:uncharacterized membrane-anchored protein
MDLLQDLFKNKKIFFSFMKEKYPVFKESNIFFRDVQYAIRNYYLKEGKKIDYQKSEKIASEFIEGLVKEGELKKISNNAWKVNFSL